MPFYADKRIPGEFQSLTKADDKTNYASLLEDGGPRTLIASPRGTTLIEPVIFIYLFAWSLSDTVITNLLEYRTCHVTLTMPDANCTDPLTASVEALVQPNTAHVITARALVEALGPSALGVFVGPWSDNNGRKPFLLLALGGMSLSYLCWGGLSLVRGLPPEAFLVASLPLSLTGGTSVIYLLLNCYLCDVTNELTRLFRMSVLTAAMYGSPVVGTALAPILVSLQSTNNPYPLVFFLSAFLMLVAFLYIHWYIRETIQVNSERHNRLFQFAHVRNIFSVCFQSRAGHARTMILLMIFTIVLNVVINDGESAVLYLSVRAMFSWQLSDYSLFTCTNNIVYGLGALSGVWVFRSLLGLPNTFSAALLVASRCARSFIKALARCGQQFYVATAVSCLYPSYSALCRTELSRLVSKTDLGKVFAMITLFESLTPMAAAPLYSYIYDRTFLHSPGTIYWISAGFGATSVLFALIAFVTEKLVRGTCYVSAHSDNSNTT